MRNIIIILFLSLNISVFGQVNELKVSYEVSAKQSMHKKAIKEPFLLLIKGNKSVFINYKKIIADSIGKVYMQKMIKKSGNSREIKMNADNPDYKRRMKNKTKISWVVEKELLKNTLTIQQKAFRSRIEYRQKLPKLAWKLQDSIKEILGYKVKKALLHYKGRDYIAWYAPAVAIPDGPYKFWGLPGLIFEIHDSKNEYSFKITGIEQKKHISFPKKYFFKGSSFFPLIKTTEKNFKKDFEKTFNISNAYNSAVVIGESKEEYIRERIKKIKSLYDNPIELNEE